MTFGETFQFRLETRFISRNCTYKLCNINPGSWKPRFKLIWALFGSHVA